MSHEHESTSSSFASSTPAAASPTAAASSPSSANQGVGSVGSKRGDWHAGRRCDVLPAATETTEAVMENIGQGLIPRDADQRKHLEPSDPLLWRVMISALYHQKRERFLDGVDRCAQALGMIGGAAAFASVLDTSDGFSIPGGFVAVVTALALCYGPGSKARRHGELARDYKLLQAELIRHPAPLQFDDRCDFEAKILVLESSEPAALGALVTQCHNELCVALGSIEDVTPLGPMERLFKNWFDFDQTPEDLVKQAAKRKSGS